MLKLSDKPSGGTDDDDDAGDCSGECVMYNLLSAIMLYL
jgi:hypothetical protein